MLTTQEKQQKYTCGTCGKTFSSSSYIIDEKMCVKCYIKNVLNKCERCGKTDIDVQEVSGKLCKKCSQTHFECRGCEDVIEKNPFFKIYCEYCYEDNSREVSYDPPEEMLIT